MSILFASKKLFFSTKKITRSFLWLFLLLTVHNTQLNAAKVTSILCGTFTIGGTNPDYATFTDAVDDLNNYGVCGPVVFLVSAGTYTENIIINEISGASSTNTIQFIGSGKSNTKITHTASSAADLATVLLNGADYISFRDLTIEATHLTWGAGVLLTKQADYNSFRNLDIKMNTSSTATTAVGISASGATTTLTTPGNNANYTTIDSVNIDGGYSGVSLYGISTTVFCTGNEITNCFIKNTGNYGILMNYQNYYRVISNHIRDIRSSSGGGPSLGTIIDAKAAVGYAIYTSYSSNFEIIANDVYTKATSLNLTYANVNNYDSNFISKIHNNLLVANVSANSTSFNNANYLQYYHNTVISKNISSGSAYFVKVKANDIQNNIFENQEVGNTSYAIFVDPTSSEVFLDNNIYNSEGKILAFYNGGAQEDLGTWKAYYPELNAHSSAIPSSFISSSNAHLDFAIDALRGPYLGVDFDVDGDSRCTLSPTIGADESAFKLPTPNASFVIADTVFINSNTRFINTSTTKATEAINYKWYVNNILKGTDKNFIYTFQNQQSYTISMEIENCFGIDSIGQSINVLKPTSVPESDFVAEKLVVEMLESVQLFDISKHGATSWKWSVNTKEAIFSNDIAANPTIIFKESGVYEICLTTANHLGQGNTACKKNYISVNDNQSICGAINFSNSPTGRLTDDGGLYGDYGNNKRCFFVIQPCALSVNLKFNSFELADIGDSIAIYDGTNNQGVLLGAFNGTFIGLPNSVTASSGSMYIEWTTNGALTGPGFEAIWSSVIDTTVKAPIASFSKPQHVYTGQEASFASTSTGKNIKFAWDFNPPAEVAGLDGGKGETDRFTWNTPGNYFVKLVTTNCGGKDSVTTQIKVNDISAKPKANFGTNTLKVPVSSQIMLIDSSDQAPTSYKWTITPANKIVYVNSSANSRNPVVYFTGAGLYTVKLKVTNALGSDSLTKTNYIEVFSYCTPAVNVLSSDIGISRVQYKNVDNITAIGVHPYNSYIENFAAPIAFKRSSFDIIIDRNTNTDSMSRKVWIDWNQNGSFSDSGELVAYEAASKKVSSTFNIKIPNNVSTGITTMRIGTSYASGNNSSCGINLGGEFEDYPIHIADDNIKPIITMIGSSKIQVEQWHSLNDPGVLVNDNLDGDITNLVFINSNFDSTKVGTYLIKYNVSDNNGNKANEIIRIVEVTPDITPPTIMINGNTVQNAEVLEVYADSGAIAMDYYNRNITNMMQVTDNLNMNLLGAYEVVYEVTDGGGNTAKEIRTVNVVDRTAPIITANSSDTIYVNVFDNLNDKGFLASDNYDEASDLTLAYDTSMFNANKTGTYQIKYFAEDLSGNKGTKVIVVIVRDTMVPKIILNEGNTIDIDVYSNYIDEGAEVIDNYCSNNSWAVSGTVNTNLLGTYTLTYSAKDCAGNSAIDVIRTVNVLDRKSPVLKLIGASNVNIRERDSYTDAGVTIKDNYYDEDTLRPMLVVSGGVDSTKAGVYSICYDLTDPSGNISNSACRIIYVSGFQAGINSQNNLNLIQLYPNPNGGEFSIENKAGFINTQLKIYDMLGKVVFSKQIESTENIYRIQLDTLPAGMYMVNLKDQNIDQNIKISIVK